MCPTSPLWTGVTCSQLRGRKWHWIGGRRLLPGQRSEDLQNKGQGGEADGCPGALWAAGVGVLA